MALSFKVAFSSQAKQGGIIQRLTRSLPDYNWATWPIFLLRLCQRVIVEDVLIRNPTIVIVLVYLLLLVLRLHAGLIPLWLWLRSTSCGDLGWWCIATSLEVVVGP